MITLYYKTVKKSKWDEVEKFVPGTWIHVIDPTDADLERLNREFKLDAGHLKDALDPYEAPRLEVEGDTVYAFTRFPVEEEEGGHVLTSPFLFVKSNDFVATISVKQASFVEKLMKDPEVFSTQHTKLFLRMATLINRAFQQRMSEINRHVLRTSSQVGDMSNEDIRRFVSFESTLNDFLISLVPQTTIFNTLLSGRYFQLYESDKELVEDLSLSSGQIVDRCKSNIKTMINIRESHETIATNNLNRVIKVLTALTIIITVPNIISGLYGMNVAVPFADSPFAFLAIIGIIAVVSLLLVGLFIRNKWL